MESHESLLNHPLNYRDNGRLLREKREREMFWVYGDCVRSLPADYIWKCPEKSLLLNVIFFNLEIWRHYVSFVCHIPVLKSFCWHSSVTLSHEELLPSTLEPLKNFFSKLIRKISHIIWTVALVPSYNFCITPAEMTESLHLSPLNTRPPEGAPSGLVGFNH